MLDKIIGLIPEFYFDLIARISPGTLICIALAFLLDAVTDFVEECFDYIYYALRKNSKMSQYRTIYEDIGGIAEYANPSSIVSLKKVAAELTLLRVLIAGWIIIGVLNKYSLHQYRLIFWIVLISLIVSYIKWFFCIKKSIAYLSRSKPKILVV